MTTAKSATDAYGHKISVGDYVICLDATARRPLKVVGIHRQGADGTILTTEPAPYPEYPHHYGCRASKVKKAVIKGDTPYRGLS